MVGAIPDAETWLSEGVPDAEKKVTLVLLKAAESYGKAVYFSLPQTKGTFETWIKDYLFLSFEQNQALMKNLDIEKMILQFEGALAPQYIRILREVRHVMLKNLKNSRKTQRPILLAVAKLDELIRSLRLLGSEAGLAFPDVAPSKAVFGPKACIYDLYCQSLNQS